MSEFASSGEGTNPISNPKTVKPDPVDSTADGHEINWQAIERADDFRELVRVKQRFIIPATIFFLVYYFGFLVLVGYFPALVEINVIGEINIAYLFALSQFFMAWILMYFYVRRAGVFDKLAHNILVRVKGENR